jgi:ribosomal-protein-alanine N-acetyltransferase
MELRTARLVLREFRIDDAETVFAYQSTQAYLEHYAENEPTLDDVRHLVATFCEWAQEVPRTKYQLAITVDDHLIGTCGVRMEAPDSAVAEFGCELDPRFWGRGYARESSRAILDFCLEALQLRAISARTMPRNSRAVRLAENLGLRRVEDGLYEVRR